MSIGTPKILLRFADTTGTVVVNSGSLGTNYTLHGSGATRSGSNGVYANSGKITGADSGAGSQTYLDITGATAPGSTLDSLMFAMAFKFTGSSLDNNSCKLAMPATNTADGLLRVTLDSPPDASGLCNLNVDFRHLGGAGTTPIKFANRTQNTQYIIACCLDNAGGSGAMMPRAGMTGTASANGSSANFTSFSFANEWPRFLARSDFLGGAYGLVGEADWIVFDRVSGAGWTNADIDSIIADPVAAFAPTWPSSGSAMPFTGRSLGGGFSSLSGGV